MAEQRETLPTKLHDLAKINRLAGKHALADQLDEAASLLAEAAALISGSPFLVFDKPGARSIVTAQQTAAYAASLGEWTRRREAWQSKMGAGR